MSNRLNQEREATLQPARMRSCQEKLESLGFVVQSDTHSCLIFQHRGNTIKFWPYSGWHTGKGIKDGRGFKHLLDQLQINEESEGSRQNTPRDLEGI